MDKTPEQKLAAAVQLLEDWKRNLAASQRQMNGFTPEAAEYRNGSDAQLVDCIEGLQDILLPFTVLHGVGDVEEGRKEFPTLDKAIDWIGQNMDFIKPELDELRESYYWSETSDHGTDWLRIKGPGDPNPTMPE